MARKTVWKPWAIQLEGVCVERCKGGMIRIGYTFFSAASARRLFQQLSGDYKD